MNLSHNRNNVKDACILEFRPVDGSGIGTMVGVCQAQTITAIQQEAVIPDLFSGIFYYEKLLEQHGRWQFHRRRIIMGCRGTADTRP